ncbi:MAG: outer membrane protein transport protein [Myxococcales bacterium]|nr:outer membrane protein transport protein [Myxococcales bacterium]
MKRTVLALILLEAAAHAGGLGRPNGISARGVGMGGAWTAWVDDATAVWFNPAALSEVDPQVDVGAELVVGPRTFTPVADDGTRGPAQNATVVAPVPSLGVVGRFWYDGQPSRFTLGGGVWNTFGGKVAFPKTGMPALDAVQDAVVEASAGTAVRVSDRLSIGAAFRIGIGLFSVEGTQMPYDASLSAKGLGVAMAWGFLFRPVETVRIGAAWRAPLRITTTGNGTIEGASGTEQVSVEHQQNWPQSASLGVGIAASPALKLAVQLDWTQWSTVKDLIVQLPGSGNPDQVYREDWEDSWTARVGADLAVTRAIAVRGGLYYDTTAVPDRTIERQYLDSNKVGLAAGGSYRFGAWRVDAALDAVLPSTRTVPQNTATTPDYDRAKAPGDYRGTLITFEASVARSF